LYETLLVHIPSIGFVKITKRDDAAVVKALFHVIGKFFSYILLDFGKVVTERIL